MSAQNVLLPKAVNACSAADQSRSASAHTNQLSAASAMLPGAQPEAGQRIGVKARYRAPLKIGKGNAGRYANVIRCNLQDALEGCLLLRVTSKVHVANRQLCKHVRIAWIERHRLFQSA